MDDQRAMDRIISRVIQKTHRIRFSPIPQARHRAYRGVMWDPSGRQKMLLKIFIRRYLRLSFGVTNDMLPLTTSYVSVDLTFLISRPISHFEGGNRNNDIRPQFRNVLPTTTGDIDNYVKFFMDSVDGIIYHNDRNVVQIRALKLYCNSSRGSTIFKIRPYENITISIDDNDDNNNGDVREVTEIL
jgi:Holliday junction resolvase RusA-like endonuclease